MSDTQQIAERLVQVVMETDWTDLERIEEREKLSDALLDAGLGEAVEALGIYVDLFGEDHAGDPARSALAKLQGEKA